MLKVKPPPMRKVVIDSKPPVPSYEPLHPAFTGTARVLTVPAHIQKNVVGPSYEVDLGAGTCTCVYGQPFQWHGKQEKWVPNFACSHKIKMMADILEKAGRPTDMQVAYAKTVSGRYNKYEVVSAFHKELRRGSLEHAVFWGTMLANFRGIKGVIRYMLNILYEETRDHDLGNYLLEAYVNNGNDYDTMRHCIAYFCKAKKKWELPHRMEVFENEMMGYEKLIEKYGREVAKGGNIIPATQKEHLLHELRKGFEKHDNAKVQFGLKGLQKMVVTEIDTHRAWIINEVYDTYKRVGKDRDRLSGFIQRRVDAGLGIGYHELNMFVDFICGEKVSVGIDHKAKRILEGDPVLLRLGVAPNIPLYAQDNHTWAGKALIREFPKEFLPEAKQEHYDLRLCGAYMGVAYRHLAMAQHKRIDCEWDEVRWPKWMHATVTNLWY